MNVIGYGTIMTKYQFPSVGISAGKYSQQEKCLQGWHNFSITGQHLICLVLPCFSNRVLRGLKCFVHSCPTQFKPAQHPQEFEKSYQLPPHTLLTHTRPTDHHNPCPLTLFQSQSRTCLKNTKNSYWLKISLANSKIKLIMLFIRKPNQNFSTHLIFRSQQNWGDKNRFSRVVTRCALRTVLTI